MHQASVPTDAGSALPPEIAVESLPHGVRYVLPVQKLGKWQRLSGFVPLILGVLWGVTVAASMQSGGFSTLSMVLGVPSMLPGLAALAAGLLHLAFDTHSEIELGSGRLVAIDCIGPIRWRRSRAIEAIRGYSAATGSDGEIHGRPVRRFQMRSHRLVAWCDGVGMLKFAMGYPGHWLAALAHELARRTKLETACLGLSVPDIFVENSIDLDDFPDGRIVMRFLTEDVNDPPPEHEVTCSTHAAGLELVIAPPKRRPQPCKQMIGVGLCLCVFTAALLGVFAAMLYTAMLPAAQYAILFLAIPVLTALLSAAFAILLAGFLMCRRQVVLTVIGDLLTVQEQGWVRTKRREWSRAQIAVIRVGLSPVKIGNPTHFTKQDLELQIHLLEGDVIGFLPFRGQTELKWIATMLRRSLQVTAIAP